MQVILQALSDSRCPVLLCQSRKVLCMEMHSSIRTEDVRVGIYRCNQPWCAKCGPTIQPTSYRGASTMLNSNNSPLESLAAFAITFAVGILSTIALGKYIEKVRRDALQLVANLD